MCAAWGPDAPSTEDDDDEERTSSDGCEQFGGNVMEELSASEGPSFSISYVHLFSFLSLHPNFV